MNTDRPASNSPLQKHPGATYTPEEIEFLTAVRAWQRRTGQKFPSFVDVLNIARDLGYRKVPPGAGP